MKMRKNFLSFILALTVLTAFCFATVFSAYAEDWKDYRSNSATPSERISERLVDDADLLTDSEEDELKEQLDSIYETYGYDAVIVTTGSLNGYTATEFADDFYDYNGFAEDGILLLISMEERDWAISTAGGAINAFTDDIQEEIISSIMSYLGNDKWYDAFNLFCVNCDIYIDNYVNYTLGYNTDSTESNHSYHYYENNPQLKSTKAYALEIAVSSIIAGIIVGLIVAFIKRAKNNKKMLGNEAGYSTVPYIDGNINVVEHYDRFIRNEHSEHFVKTESASSHSSGSTHVGSSGTTHGGSSGKF